MIIYFKPSETACRCGCGENITDECRDRLDALREAYGHPIRITSGARCESYNAKIKNSAPKSKHIEGIAVDVSCESDVDRRNLVALALQYGWSGIGVGKSFIHLDIRTGTKVVWGY